MEIVRWIRLDIPYQNDGSKMRAVVGHSADGGRLSTIVSDYSDNIPNILTVLKASFTEKGLETNESTVLIYPLDGRMGLAGVVLDAANAEKWDFNRHIPTDFYPGVEVLHSYEQDDTGSEQDGWSPKDAQAMIFQLNNEAQEEYKSHELPNAMAKIRQALQLAVKHFGWSSPGVAYSLTNFGHVMRATGNDDNMLEVTSGVKRMLFHWDKTMPVKEEWVGAVSILEQLIDVCNAMGKGGYADRLSDYKAKLC